MSAHAKLSPSSAHRWSTCTASPGQEARAGGPDNGSQAARQGTAEHLVSALCLEANIQPLEFVGRTVYFPPEGETFEVCECEHTVTLDEDASARVGVYVEFVRALVKSTGGSLSVEVRVPIDHITGEEGAQGTSDAVIYTPEGELIVIDAKFGSSRVHAPQNRQLAMYADGALVMFDWLQDFHSVRMIIVQPKLGHVSEWMVPVAHLREFVEPLRISAQATRDAPVFMPTADNCFFCKGRVECKAREEVVLQIALADFTDESALPALYAKVPLIERWCDDITNLVQAKLTAGEPVDGFKLVAGRRGARKWTDETEAEAALKSLRLKADEMYDKKIISPTKADKLELSKKARAKLDALISQPDGKPVIAPSDDPRPALASALDDFDLFS